MEEKGEIVEDEEKRSEPRLIANKYCSVEFSTSKVEPDYLFKLMDMSSSGLCIIVKEGSAVLNNLKVGDIMDMKYFQSEKAAKPEIIKTEIKHITKDDVGRYKGNYLVGLSMVEKENLNP